MQRLCIRKLTLMSVLMSVTKFTLERVMFAKFLHCDLCKLYGKLLLQAGRQSLDHRQRGAGRAPRLHRQRGAGRVPRLHRQRGAGSLQTTGRRGPAVLQGTTGRGEHAGNFVDTPCGGVKVPSISHLELNMIICVLDVICLGPGPSCIAYAYAYA